MSAEAQTFAVGETQTLAERAVIGLARAMKNVSFYEMEHPVVTDAISAAYVDLEELLGDGPELTVKLVHGYLVVAGVPLLSQHASIGNLVGACHRRGVEAMVFQQGATQEDLEHLIAVLTAEPSAVAEAGGPGSALAARGAKRIVVERLASRSKLGWQNLHATALDVLRGAARAVRTGRPLDVASVRLSVHGIVDDVIGDRSILYNLTSMKGMDEYTFLHALHLCILAVELGRHLRFSRDQLEELGVATLLHDVGKIFVPLEILRKPASLDADEFATMSRHPVHGAVALADERSLPEVAAIVAFEHHMHLDHSGYPRARRPRPLHMYSLVTSIVDVYDALTTMRPYRPALPPGRALEVINAQYVGRLEPRLLECFLHMLGPYPWGTLLRLSADRFAVVTRPNAMAPESPFARVVEVRSGIATAPEEEAPLEDLVGSGEIEVVDPLAVGIDLPALFHLLPRGGEAGSGA